MGIAERFYSRFVPDVNDQKRHLRLAGRVAFLVFSLSGVIWGFWDAANLREPITPGYVLFVGWLFFSLTLFILNLLLFLALRFMDTYSGLLDVVDKHLYMTSDITKILQEIASKTAASVETSEKLARILRQIHGTKREMVR